VLARAGTCMAKIDEAEKQDVLKDPTRQREPPNQSGVSWTSPVEGTFKFLGKQQDPPDAAPACTADGTRK
jgi:hypothetical protein